MSILEAHQEMATMTLGTNICEGYTKQLQSAQSWKKFFFVNPDFLGIHILRGEKILKLQEFEIATELRNS